MRKKSFFAGYSHLDNYSIGIEHTGMGCTSMPQYDKDGKLLPGRVIPGSSDYWYDFTEAHFVASCELTKGLQDKLSLKFQDIGL